MRVVAILLSLVALCALAWWGVEVELPAFTRARVGAELASLGLAGARFQLDHVGWDRLRLRDVHLGPDLEAESIELEVDLFGARVEALTVVGARWSVALDEHALRESTPARLLARGGGAGEGVPVARVRFSRAHLLIERPGAPPLDLAIDADIVPSDTRGELALESELLGAWSIAVRARGDTTELEAQARTGETLVLAVTPHALATRWSADGVLPAALVEALVPELELAAPLVVRASGAARGETWTLETARLDVHVARAGSDAATPEAATPEADDALLVVEADGVLAPELALDVTADVSLARARAGELRVEALRFEPALHVSRAPDGSIQARADGPIEASAGVLAIGGDDAELRVHDLALALVPHVDRPLLERTPEGTVLLAARTTARAPRASGVLSARGLRAAGDVALELGAEPHLDAPLALRVASLSQADAEVAMRDVRLTLALGLDARGDLRARGRGRAGSTAWRTVQLGASRGTVALTEGRLALSLDGRASARAPFHVDASLALEDGAGHLDVAVPVATIDARDPLHHVLRALTDLRVVGRAGGSMHAVLGPRLGEGRAHVELDGVAVEDADRRVQAQALRGTLELAHLDPVVSRGADRLRWDALTLGGAVSLREGSARVHFARREGGGSDVVIADTEASLAGGVVRVAPFRFVEDAPSLGLDLTLRGIDLTRLTEVVSSGRVRGTGQLDGRVALRLDMGERPRVVLGRGRLSARGPGRVRIRELPTDAAPARGLEELRGGEWIEQRVLAALADFQYSRLVLDLLGPDTEDAQGNTRLRARIAGRGARTPQELDLTLNVRGLQPVLDRSLVLLGRGGPQQQGPS